MKKTLALFLALVMMLSLLPFSAFAEDALTEEINESLEETVKEEVEEPGGDPASEPGNGSADESGEKPAEEPVVDPADDPKLLLSNEAQTLAATNADLSSLSLYVAADDIAGLDGKVTISLTSDAGNIYLPGTAAIGSLYLSWTPADGIWVTSGSSKLYSGEVSLPAAGSSKTYKFSNGSNTRSITLTTVQGSSTVAGMFINVDESLGTISAMNSDKKHETRCYGNVDFEYATYYMSIKGRGNWTWKDGGMDKDSGSIREKRPYNITIHKDNTYDKKLKTSFIPGVESKAWTLIANYADGSLMHNKVAYDLACAMGIGFQSRYIDVWMNGEYYGNYLMTPKNDYLTKKDGYSLELDNNNDGIYPDEKTVVNSFRLTGLDTYRESTDNVITVKDVGDNAAEALGAEKNQYGYCEPIRTWMQTMLDAVMDFDSDEYRKYIDVDSWAKFYIIYEYCKSIDMLCGSMLMHRDGLTENDKLIAGPIWDMDVAFGHAFTTGDNDGKFGLSASMQVSANGWIIDSMNGCTSFLQYLGKHQDFIERVYEIYNEYKYAFSDSISEIDVIKNQISASAAMNYTRYDVNQNKYNATKVWSDATRGSGTYAYKVVKTQNWQNYIDNFKAYLTKRLAFLSDNLTVTNPAGTATGETSYTAGDTVSLTANISSGPVTSYQWQSSDDGESWTDIAGATSNTYSAVAQQKDMNGVSYRCLIKGGTSKTISTTRVATGTVTGRAYLGPLTLSVNATALSQNISITENGETKTPETASENTKAVVKEITENSKIDKTNVQDVVKTTEADTISMMKIVLTAVSVSSGEGVTTDTVKYDVKPVFVKKTSTASETTVVTNKQLAEMLQEAGETAITFRLAVPSTMTGDYVKVSHIPDGSTVPDWTKLYEVKSKESTRYIELSADSFSTYQLEQGSGTAWNKDTEVHYLTLSEALADAKSGETVQLLADTGSAAENIVAEAENVTLDLNGFTLVAKSLSCFGTMLVDTSEGCKGLLKVARDRVAIDGKSDYIPAYCTDDAGYRFVKLTIGGQWNGNKFTCRFNTDETGKSYLANDGSVRFGDVLHYTLEGQEYDLTFTLSAADTAGFISMEGDLKDRSIIMSFTGLDNYTDISCKTLAVSEKTNTTKILKNGVAYN